MKKRILIIANAYSFLYKFERENVALLQRMGYEVRVVGRGATLERSESGVGQHIGPGGADDRTRGFAAGETEA